MKRLIAVLVLLLLVSVVSADTLLFWANNDGQLGQAATSEDWSILVGGSGNTGTDNPTYPYIMFTTAHASTSDKYTRIYRYPVTFYASEGNITSLTGATIDSAVLRLKYYGKTITFLGTNETALVQGNPTNPLDFAAADYNNLDLAAPITEFASRYDFTSSASGNNINFTLNSDGISFIQTDGDKFTFYLLDGDEIDGSFSGTWAASAQRTLRVYGVSDATQANRPYLEIAFTAGGGGDTTPPESIYNITNVTTCNSINWTWTNPGGDQNETVIWKDDTLFHNLTNSTSYDLWESLSEYTEYTFSSKTKDIAGNLNATFQNQTARTLGDPVAAFSCTPLTGAIPLSVTCTDASTRAPTTWVWYNNTTQVSTSQSPTFYINTTGDQDISLNASNTCGFDWENKTDYITTSASGCGLICKIVLYIRQFYLPYQMVRL